MSISHIGLPQRGAEHPIDEAITNTTTTLHNMCPGGAKQRRENTMAASTRQREGRGISQRSVVVRPGQA